MPKNFQQGYRCLERDLKWRPPKYKANATIRTKFAVEILVIHWVLWKKRLWMFRISSPL